MPIDICVIGFGNIGREFVKQILNYNEFLREKHGLNLKIVGLADSSGTIVKKNGFSKNELLKLLTIPRGSLAKVNISGIKKFANAVEAFDSLEPKKTLVIEVTPSNYVNGEPAKTHLLEAFKKGFHAVTANKGPLALYFNEIIGEARRNNVEFRFKATVMAGTPLIDYLSYGYFGRNIEKVYGIINATTNYILNKMYEEEVSFEEALRKAQVEGYAEPDPSLDVDGWDPAAKISIISGVLGNHISVHNVVMVSLRETTLDEVLKAKREGYMIKYIASYDSLTGEARVEPKRVKADSYIAKVRGSRNLVVVESDGGLKTVVEGPGGGPKPTSLTILSDVALIAAKVMGK